MNTYEKPRSIFDTPFDLIEYQARAREINSPLRLFQLWEEICLLYDRRKIGKYELDEMKELIWPQLTLLSRLQKKVNDSFKRPNNVLSLPVQVDFRAKKQRRKAS